MDGRGPRRVAVGEGGRRIAPAGFEGRARSRGIVLSSRVRVRVGRVSCGRNRPACARLACRRQSSRERIGSPGRGRVERDAQRARGAPALFSAALARLLPVFCGVCGCWRRLFFRGEEGVLARDDEVGRRRHDAVRLSLLHARSIGCCFPVRTAPAISRPVECCELQAMRAASACKTLRRDTRKTRGKAIYARHTFGRNSGHICSLKCDDTLLFEEWIAGTPHLSGPQSTAHKARGNPVAARGNRPASRRGGRNSFRHDQPW